MEGMMRGTEGLSASSSRHASPRHAAYITPCVRPTEQHACIHASRSTSAFSHAVEGG